LKQIKGAWAEVSWDGADETHIITSGAKQVADGARVAVR
jgi:hypothetical protein